MSTVHESTYEVVRSPGTTTILDNPVSNEERSSHVSPALPGKALNWIDGEWVDANKTMDSFDPATGERIGTYADASREDAATAIAAAVRRFRDSDWKENRQLRAKVLNQIADRFEARRDDLIHILSLENGKVRAEAALEVDMIPPRLRYWTSAVLTNYGRALEVEPGHLSFVLKSPIGVAGIIAPFNSPLVLAMRSLAPALATGVTTVIKLPGSTAQTNCMFSQVLAEVADLPRGVINVFSESDSDGSSLLVESKDVRVISFTGSTKTAKVISAAGAPTLKIFQTELGGKTPMIVFDDADLSAAAPKIEKSSDGVRWAVLRDRFSTARATRRCRQVSRTHQNSPGASEGWSGFGPLQRYGSCDRQSECYPHRQDGGGRDCRGGEGDPARWTN
jgi:delta 1-pyrroline-5-carboxylate dehydrogenase